jgi:alkanesulfonate monooxygenase SsuD/methylene tetrahydromethanopterin reductase-like flavin-dependent oxidoreductase (luciferase family)
MEKGILSIPIYKQGVSFENVLEEVKDYTVEADQLGIEEAFFGEHLTDRHEKISSSLMMVSALSQITKKIRLGTLTTNLNFYNPAVVASLIAMADNLCKGRLILGIGSGANKTDLEAIGALDEKNYETMLETYQLIEKILKKKDLIDIKSKNFSVSTVKSANKNLGLGYFNGLYQNRDDLEVIMPVLNQGSYNVKVCSQNCWSIAISNFCSQEIVEDHIKRYLENSPLDKKLALKKIRLTRYVHLLEDKKDIKKYSYAEDSPYMQSIKILYDKLKTFKKDAVFGANVSSFQDAANNILLAGTPEKINDYIDKIKSKYGDIKSLVFVTVPKTNLSQYDNSLKLFSDSVKS